MIMNSFSLCVAVALLTLFGLLSQPAAAEDCAEVQTWLSDSSHSCAMKFRPGSVAGQDYSDSYCDGIESRMQACGIPIPRSSRSPAAQRSRPSQARADHLGPQFCASERRDVAETCSQGAAWMASEFCQKAIANKRQCDSQRDTPDVGFTPSSPARPTPRSPASAGMQRPRNDCGALIDGKRCETAPAPRR